MATLQVQPARLGGRFRPPGDKSVSHRAVLLGALASGVTVARNFLEAEDTLRSVGCVRALGVPVELEGGVLRVHGRRRWSQPGHVLDAGNSGTTIRLLCGLVSGQPVEAVLDGDESLRRRPMDRVVEPLRRMGADIQAKDGRFAPVRVRGGTLRPARHELPVASAQVKSALLLAGLYAEGRTVVVEPAASRDHTERLLKAMGVQVRSRALDGGGVEAVVEGPARPEAVEVEVPGDFSSAAFFVAAAAAQPGAELVVEHVGLNPTRTGLLEVLRDMGAEVLVEDLREVAGEPVGTLLVRGKQLRGVRVGGGLIPRLIDEIPALAVAAAVAEGETVVRDAAELRVKESDRIRTVVRALQAVGVDAEELPDGMVVRGGRILGGEVDPEGDHRIAMAFAVAGLLSREGVKVVGTECAAVSFPQFERWLRVLAAR
ncbi:MAG: 3-phosphoshikimate 1-carboxyvinyltransferase [Armatimonadota bacterium]|nr:3-phosphoshikimate 1-carboxyvinyltransferase [Armatimonadota bacterium]